MWRDALGRAGAGGHGWLREWRVFCDGECRRDPQGNATPAAARGSARLRAAAAGQFRTGNLTPRAAGSSGDGAEGPALCEGRNGAGKEENAPERRKKWLCACVKVSCFHFLSTDNQKKNPHRDTRKKVPMRRTLWAVLFLLVCVAAGAAGQGE